MARDEDGTQTLTLGITSLLPSPPRFTRHVSGARVCGIEGPAAGLTLAVESEPRIIGTSKDCDLVVEDTTVSRKHLEARWTGNRLEIEDLGSKNGSHFGGERFQSMQVSFGAIFRVGKSHFKVVPAEEEVEPEEAEGFRFGELVGVSSSMRKLFTLIDQVAPTEVSVLIEGETGVGKELVAEEIHRRSGRDRRASPGLAAVATARARSRHDTADRRQQVPHRRCSDRRCDAPQSR